MKTVIGFFILLLLVAGILCLYGFHKISPQQCQVFLLLIVFGGATVVHFVAREKGAAK